MRILLCHNFYQQPGGEDQVYADEAQLLEAHGHQVIRYEQHNDAIGRASRLAVAAGTVWNRRAHRELASLVGRHQPDVVHFHNTFPLISPAGYYAARASGAAVVQTLHNFRLLCPKAVFLRDGKVCESCLGKAVAWPAVVHRCYRDSLGGTAAIAAMQASHRLAGTWHRMVDRYIALTEFSRQKFIAGGLPAGKIDVKPNFVQPDPGSAAGLGGYALFVGRLSPEKGLDCLLDAWSQLALRLPLKIVGDGPLAQRVAEAAARDNRVEWLGRRSFADVCDLVGDALLLVMPSTWYETFGRTIVEAFARGTPVVASRLGAMQELVDDGHTGRLFAPGNAADLAGTVTALVQDTARLPSMRAAARSEFLRRYTAAENYRQLIDIYDTAIRHRHPDRRRFIPEEICK